MKGKGAAETLATSRRERRDHARMGAVRGREKFLHTLAHTHRVQKEQEEELRT